MHYNNIVCMSAKPIVFIECNHISITTRGEMEQIDKRKQNKKRSKRIQSKIDISLKASLFDDNNNYMQMPMYC